jgi:D-proline reductase (dithiol) PrdB
MPIAYIPRTRERYAQYPPYQWTVNHEAPWTPLAKPLRECRLGFVTSGGFYAQDQEPLTDTDRGYRLIPTTSDLRALRIHHHGYRDDDVDRDPNCVFPLDRLRELQAAGVIGGLTESAVSFIMTYRARWEVEERGPKIAGEMQRMGADAVLLVPV